MIIGFFDVGCGFSEAMRYILQITLQKFYLKNFCCETKIAVQLFNVSQG